MDHAQRRPAPGYQVQRKTITDRQSLSAEPETLVTSSDTTTTSYQDCSAKYRTTGARHIYTVNVLDWQNSAYGAARTSTLDYGPGAAPPEQPTNVRLTANTDSLRTLEWNTPNHPYLSALKTARTGLNGQQAVADPWITDTASNGANTAATPPTAGTCPPSASCWMPP